jgi:hypothetical protein
MKKEVYILKPVIKKTGTTHAYDVYTCVDFALYNKKQVVDNGINIFEDLPINSREKTKEAFAKTNLALSIDIAKNYFESLMFLNGMLGRYEPFKYKVKCVGNKFIFSVSL